MRLQRFLTPKAGAVALSVVVLLVVFGGTFRAPGSGLLPPPSSTAPTSAPETTTTVDYSGVTLPRVAGDISADPLVEKGRSVLHGAVTAPDGLLPGATVRLERLVGDRVQRIDAVTGEDGRFRIEQVPGGRYRVRAWLAPTFTQPEPEIFFLRDGDEKELSLGTEELEEMVVRASTTPAAPIVGNGVNLAVRVADLSVDADGIAREVARAGIVVRVSVSGWYEIEPGAARATDDNGVAVFEYSCERVGSVSATAYVGGALPSPTTTTSTTSTTAPDDDDGNGNGNGPSGIRAWQDPQQDPPPTTTEPDPEQVFPLDVPPCAPVPTTTTTTTTIDGGANSDVTSTTEG